MKPSPALATLVCLPLMLGASNQTAPAKVGVPLLLEQVVETYRHLNSYRDTGTSTARFGGSHPFTSSIKFETAFQLPRSFFLSMESDMSGGHHVVWTSAEKYLRWSSDLPLVEASASISEPVAAFTGVSSGVAGFIPSLLFPELAEEPLRQFNDAKEWTEETVRGQPCFVLKGTSAFGAETLWVSKSTKLILRHRVKSVVPHLSRERRLKEEAAIWDGMPADEKAAIAKQAGKSFAEVKDEVLETTRRIPDDPTPTTVEETTEFEPQVDVELPPSQFRFQPPQEADP